jgi:predicted HTH domain antitoxin
MHAVKVHELKNNPSEALREARKAPVIVMKGDQPEAVIFHLDNDGLLALPGMRLALATAMFRDGHLPLGQAARVAELPLAKFIQHLSRAGVPAILGTAREVKEDMAALRASASSAVKKYRGATRRKLSP